MVWSLSWETQTQSLLLHSIRQYSIFAWICNGRNVMSPRPLVIRILFDVFAMIYVFALHRGWCMRHHGTHGIHVWYKRHTHTIHYTYTCIHTQPVFTLYTSKHRTSRNYIFQQSSTVTITSLIDKLSKCSVPFPTQFRLYLCK